MFNNYFTGRLNTSISFFTLMLLSLFLISNKMANPTVNIPVIQSEILIDLNSQLAEGALWNHQTQTLWWVDIENGIFHIFNPETGKNTSYRVKQRIGTVVPDQNGHAIVALQDGIYRLLLKDGSLELLARADYDPEKFRFNDGKCDPAGRFWVGTMALDGSKETAALYRMDHDYRLTKVLEGITTSNGIVWTADKKKMYYIDTPTQQVREFDYDLYSGNIRFMRVAVQIPTSLGSPDGMSIDENGNLWIAHWGGRGIYCWNPHSGELITKVEVDAKNVTSCAFGGPLLNQLFITTAMIGLSEEDKKAYSESGSLFVAMPEVKGTESWFFGATIKDE
jgi:sugar lactone lactonase YvrE